MSVSTEQYNRICNRLTTLEERVNDVIVAFSQLVSLEQVNNLTTILQTDLDNLNQTVTALENRVENLEEEIIGP